MSRLRSCWFSPSRTGRPLSLDTDRIIRFRCCEETTWSGALATLPTSTYRLDERARQCCNFALGNAGRVVRMRKPWPAEFKWRQFEPQLIVTAVGWYLRYSLSYRAVEELLEERGLSADHVTCGVGCSAIPRSWNAVCDSI